MHIDTTNNRYCNCIALRRGLNPVGYAGHFDTGFALEMPLPWARDWLINENAIPPKLYELIRLYRQQAKDNPDQPYPRPLLIAPDDQYSSEGFRRFIFYTRPGGLFAKYDQTEYLVPDNKVGDLAWAWYQDPDTLHQFQDYRVKHPHGMRDILVCTHGTVDAACAKFGYPLYRHLREACADETLRVWRVSHFGGHVFAPTLMDMPTGHYWAYIDTPAKAQQIVDRSGEVSDLREHYRGWAGVPNGFAQAAERECWQQHGWQWFDIPRSGTIVSQNAGDDPKWAEVRIRYQRQEDDRRKMYTCRVERIASIKTNPASGKERTRLYPQYRVSS
jgi:hypothetical protein